MTEYGRPLEFVELPTPELTDPDHVLVRIGGAGVCATDLHAMDGHMEPAGVSLPRVLGHENAGWVEAVGDFVSTVEVGDAVVLYPPYSCGLCVPCRRGRDMHCERHEFTGLSVDGGFAEFVRVSERSIIKLPPGLEPADVAPARGRRDHRLPRGSAHGAPDAARHHHRRDRHRRRGTHRRAASARAWLEQASWPSRPTSAGGPSRAR